MFRAVAKYYLVQRIFQFKKKYIIVCYTMSVELRVCIIKSTAVICIRTL